MLCEAEAKINNGDYLGNTPLHYACSHGHIQIVKYLMQNGSNPTSRWVNDKQSIMPHKIVFNQHSQLI